MKVLTAVAWLAGLACLSQQAHGEASAMSRKTWQASTSRLPCVIIESEALEPVAFAADELRKYLGKILGKAIPPGPAAGPSIKLRVDDVKALGDEGYRIAVNDGAVTITGGGLAGVVYGAYHFLRKCGCAFSGLAPDGEFVPRKQQIEFYGPSVEMKPRLWYRGLQIYTVEDLSLLTGWFDWMAKNGMNYVLYMPAAGKRSRPAVDPETGNPVPGSGLPTNEWFDKYVAPEVLKRGLKLDRNHHGFSSWLPPDQYFETHPEYCALVDGKRSAQAHQLSICTTNPDAVAAFIGNMKTYLRSHPAVKIIGVIPEDGYGMCECDKCRAADAGLEREAVPDISPDYLKYLPMNRAKTRRYTRFVNEVARAIRAEFPDVLVGSAAYVDLVWPDPVVRLESNVVTWVAIYWRDGAHVISADSPSIKNKAYFDCLARWHKLHPGRLILYEYYMGMMVQKSLPYPQDRIIVRDWPELEPLNIGGATIQCWPSVVNTYGLNLIAFARCGWEKHVDTAALQAEYLQGMYGSAADAVRPLYDAFHEAWRIAEEESEDLSYLHPKHPTTSGTAVMPNGRSVLHIMNVIGEERLDTVVKSARAAASNDREHRQVETLGLLADYWKKAARFYRLKDDARAAADKGDKQTADAIQKQLEERVRSILECLEHVPPGYITSRTKAMWPQALTE